MSAEETWLPHRRRAPAPRRCYCSMCVHSDSEPEDESPTFDYLEDETPQNVYLPRRYQHRRLSYCHCRNCLRPSNGFGDDESDSEAPPLPRRSWIRYSPARHLQPSNGFSDDEADSEAPPFPRRSRIRYSPSRQPSNGFSDGESDSEAPPFPRKSRVRYSPARQPRNVTFTLPSHSTHGKHKTVISGGTLSSVGGSQTVIHNHALVYININIGENAKSAFAFSIGLFVQGDSSSRRCL